MNILEQQTKIKAELVERCKLIVRITNDAKESINPNSEKIVNWFDGYYGYEVSFFESNETEWIENPNYNPNLTNEEHQIPENIVKKTNSYQIPFQHEFVCINASENTDPYEEWESETLSVKITKELFLNGTDKQIFDYFVDVYKTDLQNERDFSIKRHWQTLLAYDFNELEKFIKFAKPYYSNENGTVKFSDFVKILEEFKNG